MIVIAEDDDSYAPLKQPAALPESEDACPPGISRRAPERVLFCGWRRDMHDMIAVLDAFVYPGSELWLYNEVLLLSFYGPSQLFVRSMFIQQCVPLRGK